LPLHWTIAGCDSNDDTDNSLVLGTNAELTAGIADMRFLVLTLSLIQTLSVQLARYGVAGKLTYKTRAVTACSIALYRTKLIKINGRAPYLRQSLFWNF